ncbi:MAG: Fe-S cluster assembly protein SufD [Acidobacteriota bacterium]|nr:Fe-S cluster assembly protein SufD [Acidobacteriota bacterium]
MTKAAANKGVSEPNLVELVRAVPSGGPPWVQKLRRDALACFEETGFPTSKDEEWRQTRVAPITSIAYLPGPAPSPGRADVDRLARGGFDCPRVVLINGRIAESLSDLEELPEGVEVAALAETLETAPERIEPHLGSVAALEHMPFAALNTAALADGAIVTVKPGAVVEKPVHLVHLSLTGGAPTVSHPRVLVVVGENAQAELIETYHGEDDSVYLTNAVAEIVVGENATLYHDRVQCESHAAFHIAAVQARLARNATYVEHNVNFGAAVARHDVRGILDGEGAEATLNGLYLATGEQHVDNHTILDHARAHCPSHELYKGILADRAKAVFNGRIIVREDSQKTDAKQSNKNLLLSNDALLHTRPQLEIYADDVKCTHGATIGQLEEDALFYLRARGIGADEARSILIYAFASDILERIRHEPLARKLEEEMMSVVGEVLAAGGGS